MDPRLHGDDGCFIGFISSKTSSGMTDKKGFDYGTPTKTDDNRS